MRRAERPAWHMDATRRREAALWNSGVDLVAGTDEAGIGPLAGPVVAAAVILPPEFPAGLVDDSKKLSPARREAAYEVVTREALAWAIAEASPEEIDEVNIYWAALDAMRRAVEALDPSPGHVLVDGRTIPDLAVPQTRIVGGDAQEPAIAAASILAKVHRDRLMVWLDTCYPGYGFAGHKGYPTRAHLDALRTRGPTPIHRLGYPAVRRACQAAGHGPLFDALPADPPAWRAQLLAAGTLPSPLPARGRVFTRQRPPPTQPTGKEPVL